MKEVAFENHMFLLREDGEQTLMLDCSDPLSNKSRLPIHMASDVFALPELIFGLHNEHVEIGKGTAEGTEEGAFSAFLIDILMASVLVRAAAPFKVLEIGAVSGVLSYHLATLMGKLNPESTLCCVSNVIGNESDSQWLNRVVLVKQPPKLSLTVSEFEDTHLADGHFDIVILNGTARFDKPYETIREAERLLKKGGTLLCHAKDAPLLESSFKLIFPERREYELTPKENILVVRYEGTSWGKEESPETPEAGMKRLFAGLRQAVDANAGPETIRQFVYRIDRCADRAALEYDTQSKVKLLELKELVLDYMLNMDDALCGFYRERLNRYIASAF